MSRSDRRGGSAQQRVNCNYSVTKAEYLAQFERHLRVGAPKRPEIVAEVKSHFEENGQASTFGNPKRLADRFNRIHLGFFYNFRRLIAVPIIAWFAYMFGFGLASHASWGIVFPIIAVGGVAVLVVDSLARARWTWPLFCSIIVFTAVVTTALSFASIGASRFFLYHHAYALDAERNVYSDVSGTVSVPVSYADQQLKPLVILEDASLTSLFITLSTIFFGFIAVLVTRTKIIYATPYARRR